MPQNRNSVSALPSSPKRFRLAVLNSHPIQYFTPLYRRLAQEPDIDLTVYYCSRQGLETYDDEGFNVALKWDVPLLEGYKFRFVPNLRQRDRVGGFFSLVNLGLAKELRPSRYDALWVHGHRYLSDLLGIVTARVLRIPVLMRAETHLLLRRSRLKTIVRQPLMRFFYNHLCARCLPIGTRNREFYLAHGVAQERLFDVPYTVDNAHFMDVAGRFRTHVNETRTALGLPTGKPLILLVAKLVGVKRPQDLLTAFQRLRGQGINAALAFVGSGPLDEALQEQVVDHQIPDVHFMGFRNQSELPMFYAAADILVLPSESETWGLVINEAMCAGLPVVASKEIGAVPDLIEEGYNGFTFPAGDTERLAVHLRALVTDEGLRRRMGERSLEIIRDWDSERCVRGLFAALESLRV